MKRIDYYAVQNPWRVPKWVGAMLGGVFGVIVIGSMITIVQLTRSPTPPAAAVAAAPVVPVAAVAAPVAAAPASASEGVASADDTVRAAPKKHASKRHASRSARSKKAMKMASAKRTPASLSLDANKRAMLVAKHDTKDKRHEKDQLDKLLGL